MKLRHLCSTTLQFLTAIFVALLLAACGGGGGSPGDRLAAGGDAAGRTGSGSTTAPTITLALADNAGNASTQVTGATPLLARATVKNANGAAIPNTVVTFSLSGDLATLAPASGTALTNDRGVAEISIRSANAGSGAMEINAKATVGTVDATAKAAFSVGASTTATPVAINFVSASPADKSIVIKGAGGSGRTEVALLNFSVVDSANVGVPNVSVEFSLRSSNVPAADRDPVSLSASGGRTDANGNISVAVNSGSDPTTVRVVATLENSKISALSDTVTVTTGQPTQASFSLALEKFYVEGVNYFGTENKVSTFLADAFGAAVADGTQVVFTTDNGAIVGDGGARCLTVRGTCSVTWRSQNPLTSNGIATIIATATNSDGPLSSSIRFFNSGSFGRIYLVSGNSQGTTTRASTVPNTSTVLNVSSCEARVFNIEVVDANGNPMPEGTKIEAINADNLSITVFPDTVRNTGLPFSAANRGTVHSIKATPSGCSTTGTKTKTGSALLAVTTPLGFQSLALTILTQPFQGD